MTIAHSFWVLVLGRVIIGLGKSISYRSVLLSQTQAISCLACGIATVVVPLYLQSVSPPAIAGKIGRLAYFAHRTRKLFKLTERFPLAGILCQISINVGILSAQAISIPFSTPGTEAWRKISFLSILVAAFQVRLCPFKISALVTKLT